MTDLPLPVVAVAIVAAGAVFAMAGLLVFRRFVPGSRLEGHNEVAGWMFATVALLYSVTVAFVVFAAYQRFADATDSVTQEAAVTVSLFQEADGLPEPVRSSAHAVTRAYVKEVTESEWDSHGTLRVHTSRDALTPVWRVFDNFNPANEGEKATKDAALSALRDLERQRHLRHLAGEASMPTAFWALLIGGAIVTVAMSYLFVTRRLWVHLALVAMLGGSTAGVIALIFSINYPFTGQTHVSRRPFDHAVQMFAALDFEDDNFLGAPAAPPANSKAVTVDGARPWTDTGIDVRAGEVVAVTTTGEVFAAPTIGTGPNGLAERPDLARSNVLARENHAALIGRIGANGVPFPVGSDFSSAGLPAGRLYLGINDIGLENNDGQFLAVVRISPA